jgi:hypothetical protein
VTEVATTPKPQTEADRALELVNKLWGDKDVGRTVRTKARELFPDSPATVDEQIEPLLQPFKDEVAALTSQLATAREEREARDKADADARAELAMRGEFDQARSRFRLNEAGEELTLKLMRERGITSPLAAAALVVADNPPPKDPSGYLGPQNMNLYGSGQESQEERIKLLHKSPMDRFIDAEFADFLAEPADYMRSAGIPDWQIQASIG